MVGGGAPPPEQERAPKQCISCPNVHQTRLIQWETTLYHVSEEVWTPSPGKGTGAAGGLGPPPEECDPGRQGCRTPRSGDGLGSEGQGGVPCDLQLL